MNLIKLYSGNNDSILALYANDTGFYVTETGAKWNKELIARAGVFSTAEAIAYTDDIASHCPLCYQAVNH